MINDLLAKARKTDSTKEDLLGIIAEAYLLGISDGRLEVLIEDIKRIDMIKKEYVNKVTVIIKGSELNNDTIS